jgi:osmoprotectant transport system ATP-binding protein
MLMDEPFGAVDPIVRERLQNEFLRLQAELAKTILFVTHDIDEAIKMGDLVAVMQAGGRLAQFGPPAEILAAPASDFVARFVGADRGLKRLSLATVADLAMEPAVTARSGESAGPVLNRLRTAGIGHVLVVDAEDRPIGWIRDDDLARDDVVRAERASAESPLFGDRTTLKDALSMLLGADVQAGIVVDRHGRVQGLVTADAIAGWLRDSDARQTAGGEPR